MIMNRECHNHSSQTNPSHISTQTNKDAQIKDQGCVPIICFMLIRDTLEDNSFHKNNMKLDDRNVTLY